MHKVNAAPAKPGEDGVRPGKGFLGLILGPGKRSACGALSFELYPFSEVVPEHANPG
jgi:hypothetical protein